MVRTKRGDAGVMLSGNIRAARELRGMTQERLAEEAEISLGLVAKLEQGRWTRSPDALTLARIAQALGVSLDALLGMGSPGREGRADWQSVSDVKIRFPQSKPPLDAKKGRLVRLEGRVRSSRMENVSLESVVYTIEEEKSR